MHEERMKQSAPMFSKKTKILIAVYLLGCVLIYFGIPQLFIGFCGSGQLKYKPETDIFGSLFNAAVILIRPFLVAVVCAWPFLIIFGFWKWGSDLLKYLRKLTNRDDAQD